MASTYPSIHFSLDEDTLEITVGCPLCAYPSIHVDTLKITVGCLVCGVVCWCVVVVCVVVMWWCVCVVCGEAWHTLSLSCSLSFLFRQQIQCCMCRCRCQRRLLKTPLPPLLERVNKAASKVSTKSAFEDV